MKLIIISSSCTDMIVQDLHKVEILTYSLYICL